MDDEVINKIQKKFSGKIIDFQKKSDKRFYILIDRKDLLEVIGFVFNNLNARYIIETGLDTPKGIEIMYHFSFDSIGKVVTLRVIVPHEKAEVETISRIIKGAAWIEREIQDILGVKFLNHPDPRRFILADDWPEGVYPYRKK